MFTPNHAKPEFEQGSTKDSSSSYNRSALEMAAERVAARQHLPTPNSSPAHRGTKVSSNLQFTSHLPTPQSPGNKDAYSTLSFDPETPTRNKTRSVPAEAMASLPKPLQLSPSFLTPESSPFFPRRGRLSRPFRTPSPRNSDKDTRRDSSSLANGSERSITPPPVSREISPLHSGLSSPFIDRRSQTNGHSPSTPKQSDIGTSLDSPMVVDDIFSPGASTSRASRSLQAPIPQRPVGGEIHRIRLQLAADQATRQDEVEARRPEYLKRLKRPSSGSESDFFNDPPEKETDASTLGVVDSPVKGRRLTLFQATSEETFEQSLSTSGYRRYGAMPAYSTDPQTPENKSKSQLSQQALDWLQRVTPGKTNTTASAESEHDVDWVPSEKEIKKRRRLAAFEGHSRYESSHRLFAVEVEGKGRVLMDQATLSLPATPQKQKVGRKRKVRASSPAKKAAETPAEEIAPPRPNWLDSQFPWAMRNQERSHLTRMEQEERMKWIEHFLDRSSSDEEDEGDQSLGPPVRSDDIVDHPPRRGRGKMVPLKANPQSRSAPLDTFLIPSDPADARAALLSKRSVRSLAFRKRLQGARDNDDSDSEVLCICGGSDDGRELVQCDECRAWYHLQCIGIKDVSELGREEDPWFCADCLGLPTPSDGPASEPTFAPTDDRPLETKPRDPLFFQGSLQESPTTPWSAARIPRTPIRGRNLTEAFSSRTSWDSSSQVGPSTPRNSTQSVRVQRTPTIFDGVDWNESPFDPTSTPSRGMHFSGPFTTPKGPTWAARNGLMQTPTARDGSKTIGGPLPFTFDPNMSRTPPRTVYTYEDTPVQRSIPRAERGRGGPQPLLESPLSSRSGPMYPLGLQDSPLMRMSRQNTGGRKGAVRNAFAYLGRYCTGC
ncbi:unnamed protein product [Somion occarium]|uniref:PHD-type domain-containing protein n=1 Tax=Somion occarium TaxID=3059160 RepID=A0ABP1CRH1_9APHY